jgi:hypothetical protein
MRVRGKRGKKMRKRLEVTWKKRDMNHFNAKRNRPREACICKENPDIQDPRGHK